MPYISEIVGLINTDLSNFKLKDDLRFVKKMYGVCELLPRNSKDSQETLPCEVSINGTVELSELNDRYSIIVYHRCLELIDSDQNIPSFGDGFQQAREEAKMRMIVFADRNKILMQPQQLGFLLKSALQKQLPRTDYATLEGLYGVTIEANTTNFNSVSIYTSEYNKSSTDYFLDPNQFLLAIDYTITSDYNVSCLSDCQTC